MKKIWLLFVFLMMIHSAETAICEQDQQTDILLFCGQSNMSGLGEISETWPERAPQIIDGAGWEFRAMSKDDNKLFRIEEPFGVNENKRGGISEPGVKSGSMVTAFVNAYYQNNGRVPVVAISASRAASSIDQWQPGGNFLRDVFKRLDDCQNFLHMNTNLQIRHIYLIWCQGETDADYHMQEEEYHEKLSVMMDAFMEKGVEKMFMVRIGQYKGQDDLNRYHEMIKAQTNIAQNDDRVVLVSCLLAGFRDQGLMKDQFHYYQAGYNMVGTDAGIHAAQYVVTGMEPSMEDPFLNNLYRSNCNH